MKKFAVAGLMLGALLFAATADAATSWDMATPYPEQNFHTQNILMFAKEIEQETGGQYKIKVHSNASLLKMPDIKRGVQTGQAALGEILLSAYGNSLLLIIRSISRTGMFQLTIIFRLSRSMSHRLSEVAHS